MSITQQISTIVEQMPVKKQSLVFELVKNMIVIDDVLSAEDIRDIRKARDEFARGDFVRHEEVNWN